MFHSILHFNLFDRTAGKGKKLVVNVGGVKDGLRSILVLGDETLYKMGLEDGMQLNRQIFERSSEPVAEFVLEVKEKVALFRFEGEGPPPVIERGDEPVFGRFGSRIPQNDEDEDVIE